MILGTDISHWEDNPETPKEIDFNQMKMAGANFCIFKSTQGKTHVDRVFQISWADCKGIMPRGVFHWIDWTCPGLDQAKHFVDVVYGKGDDPEITPVIDFEDRNNVPARSVANGHLWNWLQYVEKTTNRVPMIYTSPAYWAEFGNNNVAWRKYRLWIANYGVLKPAIPAPWIDYAIWQYTAKGNGKMFGAEAVEMDLNWFNGTYEDLMKWCGTPLPQTKTLEERVSILETQAHAHGWNLEG
jgi:lysozyme